MDNLHFVPNNILTKFFKELTKYKNDYQQYLNYIQELYYVSYCISLNVSMYMHKVTNQFYLNCEIKILTKREMLMSDLMALIQNSFQESFDIAFMENEKICQNINCFFFFFPKKLSLTRFLTNVLRAFVSMSLTKIILSK